MLWWISPGAESTPTSTSNIFRSGFTSALSDQMNHRIDKKPRQFMMLEHVLIEKVMQLFRNLLCASEIGFEFPRRDLGWPVDIESRDELPLLIHQVNYGGMIHRIVLAVR